MHMDLPLIGCMKGRKPYCVSRARQSVVLAHMRDSLAVLKENCAQGEGACGAAAHRSAIYQAQLLADIQETHLHMLELQERERIEKDSQEAKAYYQRAKFLQDFNDHIGHTLGFEQQCIAGKCLWSEYADAPERYRNKIKRDYENRVGARYERFW